MKKLMLLLLLTGGKLYAQNAALQPVAKRTITGVVRDTSDLLIPGAVVTISDHNFEASTVTDSTGRFTFTDVKSVSLEVIISATGYRQRVLFVVSIRRLS